MKKVIIALAVDLIASICWSEVLSSNITDIAKLKPLMGTWEFTYFVTWVDTGIRESFTDTYTLNNIYKHNEKYYIDGQDHTFGTGVYVYYHDEGRYYMYDSLGGFYYVFNFTEADAVAGTYHLHYYIMVISVFFTGIKVGEVSPDPCPIIQIYGEHSTETELLRSIRDNVFSKTQEGQELIKLYYQWSPVIVRAMEADEDFKQEVKEMVDEILPLISQ